MTGCYRKGFLSLPSLRFGEWWIIASPRRRKGPVWRVMSVALVLIKVLASVLAVEHTLMLIKVLASVLAVEHTLMLIKVLAGVLAVEQRSEYTCRVNKILLRITPTLQVKRFSNVALSSCSSGYIKSRHIGYKWKLYNLCNNSHVFYYFVVTWGGTWQTLQFAGNLYSVCVCFHCVKLRHTCPNMWARWRLCIHSVNMVHLRIVVDL